MTNPSVYTELEILSFERLVFAHSLIADNYSYQLNSQSQGLYGKPPANGGILEIGFVEQNPVILSGELGEFLLEENGIFIIPPRCDFSVKTQEPGMHRHTSVEFLVHCRCQQVSTCAPAEGRCVTLPFYIPPSPENSEIFALIRNIACAKTAQPDRSYFAECAEFMQLMHLLSERVQCIDSSDTVSPGNRRHCARAKAYVSQNINRRLTVSDVAAAVGVSKNYLTNVFSNSEGVTLMEYINRSKLSYMTMLIRRYGYTLAEAGKHVGMTDVNYISRIFKRYYGMTVTEYKRSLEHQDNT